MSRIVKTWIARPWPFVALALLLFGMLAWSGVREKSMTYDEIAHVTAGCSYWLYGDYRLHPENGVLPQRLESLPLVATGVTFPPRDDPDWRSSELWELGHKFFYETGNDFRQMLWRARGVVVLLGMVLGAVVFIWSRQLFGVAGGLVSLALYVFCPTLLAHSALATSDLTATLMFVVALGCSWRALHKVTIPTVAASGLALGLLAVSKMSSIVIVPVILLLVVWRIAWRRPLIVGRWQQTQIVVNEWKQLAILAGAGACQALLVVGVIWSAYAFQPTIFGDQLTGEDRLYGEHTVNSLAHESAISPVVRFANRWRLLPEPFLYGFLFAVQHSQARASFLAGEFSVTGFTWFFPTALALKTPLPTLALILAAVLTPLALWRRGLSSSRRRVKRLAYRAAPLVVFLIVYWWIALRSNLNIGHRHILPTYPMMFILCGVVAEWLRNSRRSVRAVPILLIVSLAVASLAAYPHYLAYFNQLAGGPPHGYRYLVDSSLDWGQDLPGLRRWLDERRGEQVESPVYLSYFGTGSPQAEGIDAILLPGCPDRRTPHWYELEPGAYCISATMLQSVYAPPRGLWTEKYEQTYQGLLSEVTLLNERRQTGSLTEEELERWMILVEAFDFYRLNRLCANLRLREPDDTIGYSILIYELSADDLDRALRRPLGN